MKIVRYSLFDEALLLTAAGLTLAVLTAANGHTEDSLRAALGAPADTLVVDAEEEDLLGVQPWFITQPVSCPECGQDIFNTYCTWCGTPC